MRGGAQEPFLQVAPHAVGDGKRHNQRSDPGRNAQHADRGNHPDHRLAPLGPEITRRNEQFKTHLALAYYRRRRGELMPSLAGAQAAPAEDRFDASADAQRTGGYHLNGQPGGRAQSGALLNRRQL